LHGEFIQKGYIHLEGKGCPECGKRKRHHIKRNDTIKRFVDFHGKDTYSYDLVPSDIRQTSRIPIICSTPLLSSLIITGPPEGAGGNGFRRRGRLIRT
jgi:hypothetical protein